LFPSFCLSNEKILPYFSRQFAAHQQLPAIFVSISCIHLTSVMMHKPLAFRAAANGIKALSYYPKMRIAKVKLRGLYAPPAKNVHLRLSRIAVS
jgi:hypothetical protein